MTHPRQIVPLLLQGSRLGEHPHAVRLEGMQGLGLRRDGGVNLVIIRPPYAPTAHAMRSDAGCLPVPPEWTPRGLPPALQM